MHARSLRGTVQGMATKLTHITHRHRYWHIVLMRGDEIVNGVDWLVAAPSHTEALRLLERNGMLPTDYTNEADAERSEDIKLLPGYSLSAEVVEWEGDGSVARFF